MKIRLELGGLEAAPQYRFYVETVIRRALQPVRDALTLAEVQLDADAATCVVAGVTREGQRIECRRERTVWTEALEEAANALAVELQRSGPAHEGGVQDAA